MRTITGTVFDPFAQGGKANAKVRGQYKAVAQGGIVWPYKGDANYGDTVTFTWEPPTQDELRARVASLTMAR